MSQRPKELSAEELWSPCDLTSFDFRSTATLPSEVTIIGQDRAVHAIDFGVGIASHGFNIYAMGRAGTGRSTTTRTLLETIAADQPVPDDWVYVNNFSDPNSPNAISMPPGTAAALRRDMRELVDDLLHEIPRAFESKDYERQTEAIVHEMQEERSSAFAQLEHKANERGFTLLKTAMGIGIAPVLNGQVLTPEGYQQLDEDTRREIDQSQQTLQSELAETMRLIRDLEKGAKRRLQEQEREIAGFAVGHLIEDLADTYGHVDEMRDYLENARTDIIDHVGGFKGDQESAEALSAAVRTSQREALLRRYEVNVIVDNAEQKGAPVIVQPNPTYGNLIGRIEHRAEFGALVTDFTMIKAGCLHRANGGYLVLEVRGLLSNTFAWEALKRAIKRRSIQTEEMGVQMQTISTVTLEPEPIPLSVKIVLIGDAATAYLLHELDEDFHKLFKVHADFASDYDRTDDTCREYARFIGTRCHQEDLLPFDVQAVGRVVEHGSRLAENQNRLVTRFGEIADIVREASYWAARTGQDRTTAEHVQKAIDETIHRSNRAEERIQELIEEGTIRVDVEGMAVGQVNGLSVLSLGNYSFGKPSRITVRTYTGKAGVISLDREAKLSGRIYDKGLLTLTGYLGGKYALADPLSLSATISFEQLYEGIDGDSASSTELYALLSSLSGIALSQGIAVTGSVDQEGSIQPVGGVNAKIEGFFQVCNRHGLTGEQGVVIPRQNVVNLMLREDVRQAVGEGRFHIYPVSHIDEGLHILTGMPAGSVRDDGNYPSDSVHGRVVQRLAGIAENLKPERDDERPE